MRVSLSLFIFLTWMGAIVFSAELHATTLLPGERPDTEQSSEGNHVDARRAVAIWDQAAAWVWSKQREFHRKLTRELRQLRGKHGVGWALVLMSFLYGVFHAAGPGHGKAVLTTYLLTHRQQLYRGVAMGAVAALLQGVTALLLVYGLIGFAGWLPRETQMASLWATRISFGLLVIVGLYVLARAAVSVVNGVQRWQRDARHGHTGHTHGESCGCKHVPSVAEIDTAGSRRAAAGVVLAIGLRPCSGAVLVLILASVMDLAWHGALAVLAMSLGTAITIVTLAILATKAREWASAVVAHRSPLWALAGGGVGVLGGALLLLFGLLLLSTSFATRPLLSG
ncbi:MAG: nickel/cobalt transporter [Gammaproteobacteria bacterium]|nr:nickel/cobalt transporter [Gammaproteobacteria bacterium]